MEEERPTYHHVHWQCRNRNISGSPGNPAGRMKLRRNCGSTYGRSHPNLSFSVVTFGAFSKLVDSSAFNFPGDFSLTWYLHTRTGESDEKSRATRSCVSEARGTIKDAVAVQIWRLNPDEWQWVCTCGRASAPTSLELATFSAVAFLPQAHLQQTCGSPTNIRDLFSLSLSLKTMQRETALLSKLYSLISYSVLQSLNLGVSTYILHIQLSYEATWSDVCLRGYFWEREREVKVKPNPQSLCLVTCSRQMRKEHVAGTEWERFD